jgi:hypothetical protein
MAWDTCQDLEACFIWKQVALGFPSLASKLAEARQWLVHVAPLWRLRRGQVEDGRVDATAASDPAILILSFSMHYALRA